MTRLPLLALTLLLAPLYAHAQDGTNVITLKDNMFFIASPNGGNIVASTGENGTFIIDDNLADRATIINDTITALSGEPAKFVLNTHFHFDHTGTNELMGKQDAMIIAHDNVRKRLSTAQIIPYFGKTMAPMPAIGLPVVTFSDNATFHFNNNAIKVIHTPHAHTDGDAFAHFQNANIIAAGDLVFNGIYPFIDIENGGSIKGVIAAVETMLTLADENTIIAPGHGQPMSTADLQSYHDMLATITKAIENAMALGTSLEDIIAAQPTAEYDPRINQGFITAEVFTTRIYNDLKRKNGAHGAE